MKFISSWPFLSGKWRKPPKLPTVEPDRPMMSIHSPTPSFENLSGPDNYWSWRHSMQRFLWLKNLCQDPHGASQLGKDPDWHPSNNDRVLAYFLQKLDDKELLTGVEDAETAWKILRATYACWSCSRLAPDSVPGKVVPLSGCRRSALLGCMTCTVMMVAVDKYGYSLSTRLLDSTSLQILDIRSLWLSKPAALSEVQTLTSIIIRLNNENEGISEAFELRWNVIETKALYRSLYSPAPVDFHVSRWLRKCKETHDLCQRPDLDFVPRRLLRIGLEGFDSYLVDREDIVAIGQASYAALSYCWGSQDSFFTTKRMNLQQHRQGISLHSLPQTLRDAVTVCRTLGILFLWVDALCIVQDDDHDRDWYEQSGEMLQIYSNAVLVIAADLALNVNSGFLHCADDSKRPWKSFEVSRRRDNQRVSASIRKNIDSSFRLSSPKDPWSSIANSPLSKRGWALQENILPVRILHFTAWGMVWECNSSCFHEIDEMKHGMGMLAARALRVAKLARIDSRLLHALQSNTHIWQDNDPDESVHDVLVYMNGNSKNAVHFSWRGIVTEFTRRALTKDEDKLRALSGVASLLMHALGLSGDAYLAGLWKEDIAKGLLWYVTNPVQAKRPLTYHAPTWSWASVNGRVEYFKEDYQLNFKAQIILDSGLCERSMLDPTGRVRKGHLVLTGEVVEVTLRHESAFRIANRQASPLTPLGMSSQLRKSVTKSQYNGQAGGAGHAHQGQFSWVETHPELATYEVLCDEAMQDTTATETTLPQVRFYCLLIGRHMDLSTRGGERIWWLVLRSLTDSNVYQRVGIGYFQRKFRDFDLFDCAKTVTVKVI